MPSLSFADFSSASRKTVLAAKASKTLHLASRGTQVDQAAREVLARARRLLSEIRQGSLLIEKRPLEKGLRADLEAFGHALRSLPPEHWEATPSEVFQGYLDILGQVSRQERVDEQALTELAAFFGSLSDRFFRDMQGVPGHPELPTAQLAFSG